jgi:hypothetical protein
MKTPDHILVTAYRRVTKRRAIERVREHVRKVRPHQRR